MQAVTDYVRRFVPFVPPLSAIAIDMVVNAYFFPFDYRVEQVMIIWSVEQAPIFLMVVKE